MISTATATKVSALLSPSERPLRAPLAPACITASAQGSPWAAGGTCLPSALKFGPDLDSCVALSFVFHAMKSDCICITSIIAKAAELRCCLNNALPWG